MGFLVIQVVDLNDDLLFGLTITWGYMHLPAR